jgi:hypothetical protein
MKKNFFLLHNIRQHQQPIIKLKSVELLLVLNSWLCGDLSNVCTCVSEWKLKLRERERNKREWERERETKTSFRARGIGSAVKWKEERFSPLLLFLAFICHWRRSRSSFCACICVQLPHCFSFNVEHFPVVFHLLIQLLIALL